VAGCSEEQTAPAARLRPRLSAVYGGGEIGEHATDIEAIGTVLADDPPRPNVSRRSPRCIRRRPAREETSAGNAGDAEQALLRPIARREGHLVALVKDGAAGAPAERQTLGGGTAEIREAEAKMTAGSSPFDGVLGLRKSASALVSPTVITTLDKMW
jgi:hypothetical protein